MLSTRGYNMTTLVIIAIAAIVGICSFFITNKADNPVEQAAETVIDSQLGLPPGTIDLTPEKKN